MSETSGAVGTWILTMMTPIGKQMPEVVLNLDGTGSIDSSMGMIEISGAAYDGDGVTFSVNVNTPMGEIELAVSGTAAGDDFSGSAHGPMGAVPITGVRQS